MITQKTKFKHDPVVDLPKNIAAQLEAKRKATIVDHSVIHRSRLTKICQAVIILNRIYYGGPHYGYGR